MNKHIYAFFVLAFSLACTELMAQPTVAGFTPASGPVGTSITITGTGFSPTPANNTVFFGATQATVNTASTTALTATVPLGATHQPITVLVAGLMSYSKLSFSTTYTGGGTLSASSFDPSLNVTTGTNPPSIAIGDLDGDGKADMVVTNYASHTVSIFRNTSSAVGNVSYAPKVDFATGTNPLSVTLGDLDGDGKLDLAVANFASNTLSIFRNTSAAVGVIALAARTDFATGTNPFSVAIGDLDNDGKTDLAVVNEASNTVSIFRNTSAGPGNINYDPKVDFGTGTAPRSVAIGDVDADGKVDLAVDNWISNTVSVLRNTSSGPGNISCAAKIDFATRLRPISVSMGDLDGDGKVDLALVNRSSHRLSVFRNVSTGTGSVAYAPRVDLITGTNPLSVSIGDLDGDGKADLAAANYASNTVSFFKNTGTLGMLSFAGKVDFSTGPGPHSVRIGDSDNDGKADVAVANYLGNTISVFRRVAPVLPTIANFTPVCGPVGTSVTITGTGFSSVPTDNTVFFGATRATVTGATSTQLTVIAPAGVTYDPISVLINGLVAYSKIPFATSYSGGGSITAINFESRVDFSTGIGPSDVAIGDLDGDGKSDLAIANQGGNSISILRNTGAPAAMGYAAQIDFSTGPGSNPVSISSGDLDGDGRLDLAVTNLDNSTVSIFRNISTGPGDISFSGRIDLATNVGADPKSISIADFDGDGKVDLLLRYYFGNLLSIYRNTSSAIGTISYAPKTDFNTGIAVDFGSLAIGDFDSDNMVDIVVTSPSNNSVAAYRNISTPGTISFAPRIDFFLSLAAEVATGDLDGDDKIDVAVRNGNFVSVFRNRSTGSGDISFAAKLDFTIAAGAFSIGVGDLDGDCKADLALVSDSNNTISLMQNTSTGAGSINFAATVDFPSGINPVSVAIGDLDGDGKADVAVPNLSDNTVSILRRNNTGLPGGRTATPGLSGTTIEVNQTVSEESVSVYPNPAKDWVVVSLGSANLIKEVTIYQSNGVQLAVQSVSENVVKINVAGYPRGMYLIRIAAADGTTSTLRLLKE